MSVCWLSSASRKTFRTILSLHGDAVLTSVSMETITWKTLYLLPWATGGHLHGDTQGFNIECVSLMCHMDSLVEETLCVLFWKKYGTLLFNILKNFIWFDINVMTHRTPPLCLSQTNTLLSSVLTEAQLLVFTGSDLIFWVCFWKRSQRLHVGRQVTETLGVKPAQTERADLSRTFDSSSVWFNHFFYRFFKCSTETPKNNKTWVMIQSLQ